VDEVEAGAERPLGGGSCGGHGEIRGRSQARDVATDAVLLGRVLPRVLRGHYSHGYIVSTPYTPRQPNFENYWKDGSMPMRTDCKNYESRTYPTGETVRKCNIDLAPEAPWRCPENCTGFAPRLADVNWAHGNLLSPPTPPEPPGLDDGAAELLDEAEDIVNAAGPRIMAELGVDRDREKAPWWKRRRRK
jgi:hypothetical protein